MTDLKTVILLLLLLVLTLNSAFFSGSEVAFFSLSEHTIRSYGGQSDPRKRQIADLLRRPYDLLVTIFMLNVFINILIQNVASSLFSEGGWGYKVGIPLVLTLLFGEVIPKYIGLRNNVAIAYRVVPLISWYHHSLAYIRRVIIAITIPIAQLLFFYLKRERGITREELFHTLESAEQQHVVDPMEAGLIRSYLQLYDLQVKELMRPREDVCFYDMDQPLERLEQLLRDGRHQIPICEHDLEKVVGTLLLGTYMRRRRELTQPRDLLPWLHKPLFVPESSSVRLLMRRFYRQQESLALVVDEYGVISGMITRGDLAQFLLESVGEKQSGHALYTKSGPQEIIASGRMELAELNDFFQETFTSESAVTVGGWLCEQLDMIPMVGNTYETKGILFYVLTASSKRVQRIYIRRVSSSNRSSGELTKSALGVVR